MYKTKKKDMSSVPTEELAFQHEEKENRAAELVIANKELAFQNGEKKDRAAELIIANKELAFQKEEKKKRADELVIANKELAFQNEEKGNRAAELVIANKELAFQTEEKEDRAAELVIANKELAFQTEEKEDRAAELIIANKELIFQNEEKENRAAELVIANKELAFQNEEKENRAAELIIANKELAFQNEEKENRAAELIIANKELAFQNEEKENRAAELIIANKELAFQNEEKENRAAELIIANEHLKKAEYQIAELNIGLEQKIKERTAQLEAVNNEMESFSYSVSHDLRAPLRAINGFTQILVEDYQDQLDPDALDVLNEIVGNSNRMGQLIDNLLEFARFGKQNLSMVNINITEMVESIVTGLQKENSDRQVSITIHPLENITGDKNMLKQVFINLISNAFKYTGKTEEAVIEIGSYKKDKQSVYYVKDNGAGFDMKYYDKLYGVFQRLHSSNEFEGTGVGLAIIKRIINKHSGSAWAEGIVDQGACFYISLPTLIKI
ncbi:sensor histidine kinase [Pedobacter hartonius]|uniref:histidine kinase n=1 Tax=Pedobacter hartonius TaxID=425514 RepID=A0A1H4H890_9SPHI|nr:ATP-binding protein [Pedobacter hartonius]SEB18004.1 His Kinase A (phospho-acceptor) domain-containing protein [Pedobacter hartonius]